MTCKPLLAAAVLALAAAGGNAAVLDSSAGGFTVKLSPHIAAPPAEVYRKFLRNVGDWWNSAHTFSGSARNLSFDEKPMGCFCEKLPDGGFVRHMEMIYLAPNKTILLSGALGPMQPLAATGTMRLQFSADGDGTKLEVTYSVAGYLPGGMNTFAAPADGMLTEQFTRFKNYVEHGDPGK